MNSMIVRLRTVERQARVRRCLRRRQVLVVTAIALLLAACADAAPSRQTAQRAPADAKRPDIASACADLVGASVHLVALTPTDENVRVASEQGTAPKKGLPMKEADFGTCLVRVTDHKTELPPVDGKRPEFARNDYSRREPFNADDTRILVYGSGGYWHLYDAHTLAYVEELKGPAGDAEPQWHPTDPSTLYYLPRNGGTEIFALDIRNNRSRKVADFAGRLPWRDASHLWTKSEGSPSRDGRYWGFQAEAGDKFEIRGYVVYDLVENRIVGTRSTSVRPDHVSMTPSGRWFVASGDSDGTWAWSPDFTSKKKLHHKSEHSDLAIGPNGDDEYVSVDFQSSDGDFFFVDIDTCPAVAADADEASVPECPRTVLFPTYLGGAVTSIHISGKAYAKPGWVLISTYATGRARDDSWPWYANKIMAVELTASPRIFGLGYHHVSNYKGYWTEPHGAVDRAFTRFVFNSNWNTASDTDVDDYMIVLPAGAIPPARGAATATQPK